jgi:phage protein D
VSWVSRNHVGPFIEFEFGTTLTGTDRYVTQNFLDRVLGIEITHTDFGAKEVRATLDNFDLRFFKESSRLAQAIDAGQAWTLRWGYGHGQMSGPLQCVVTGVRGMRELEVTALDQCHRFRTPVKKRTFPGPIRRSDVVERIARAHGFRVTGSSIFPTSAEFPSITQSVAGDGEFITQLADKLGYIWYLEDWNDGETPILHFKPRFFGQRPSAKFTVGSDQRLLGDPVFHTDLTRVPESAVGQLYDPYRKRIEEFKAKNSLTKRPVLATATPNAPGVGGNPADLDGAGKAVLQTGATSKKDLAELVDGFWKIRDQALIKASVPLQGMPGFGPDIVITLEGVGDGLDGDWYVAAVKHHVREGEWRMDCDLLRDGLSSIDIFALREQVLEELGGQRSGQRTGFQWESDARGGPVSTRAEKLGANDDATAEPIRRPVRRG